MENLDDTITLEVKSRLNDLFGETVSDGSEPMDSSQQNQSPLKDLKSAVLSIDWEITDEVMNELLEQVEILKQRYAEDRILKLFLQLIGAVGKYIQVNRQKSHPTAFKLLNGAFAKMEEVVTTEDLTESEKKRYLYGEIIRFKDLKQKIAGERSRASMEKEPLLESEPIPSPWSPAEDGSEEVMSVEGGTGEESDVAEAALFDEEPVTLEPEELVEEKPAGDSDTDLSPPPQAADESTVDGPRGDAGYHAGDGIERDRRN
jgi:hypothetical protein